MGELGAVVNETVSLLFIYFLGDNVLEFLIIMGKNCKKINKKNIYKKQKKTIEKKNKNPPCLGQDLDSRAHVSPEAGRSCIKLCRPPHDCRPRGHRNLVLCTDLIFVVFQEVLRHLLCKLHLKGGTDHVREGAGGGCGILLPVLISPDPPFYFLVYFYSFCGNCVH